MAKQLLSYKIDSKINKDTLDAIERYMELNNRNKSDAIRLLLIKSLEIEGLLKAILS